MNHYNCIFCTRSDSRISEIIQGFLTTNMPCNMLALRKTLLQIDASYSISATMIEMLVQLRMVRFVFFKHHVDHGTLVPLRDSRFVETFRPICLGKTLR